MRYILLYRHWLRTIRDLFIVTRGKVLEFGQLFKQHAADFEDALWVAMHMAVASWHDNLGFKLGRVVEPRTGKGYDSVPFADYVAARQARLRFAPDYVMVRYPRPGAGGE